MVSLNVSDSLSSDDQLLLFGPFICRNYMWRLSKRMQTTKIALVENPVSVPYVIFSPFFHLPFLPKVE